MGRHVAGVVSEDDLLTARNRDIDGVVDVKFEAEINDAGWLTVTVTTCRR